MDSQVSAAKKKQSTTYAWPYMFVPKRMIFPETAIFMKDVATCHIINNFPQRDIPMRVLCSEWQWRSPFNFMRSTPFKACQKAWKPPAWSHVGISMGSWLGAFAGWWSHGRFSMWLADVVHFYCRPSVKTSRSFFTRSKSIPENMITATYSVFCYVSGIPNNIYQLVARLLLSVGPLPSLRLSWSSNQWGS